MLDLLFPTQCINCGVNGEYICTYCFKKLKNTLPECYYCRRISNRYLTHKECKKHNIEAFFVGWEYNEIAKKIMSQYKYRLAYRLSEVISEILIQRLEKTQFIEFIKKETIVIPMPIHNTHQKERGFNQSTLIARRFSKYFQCNLKEDLLIRVGDPGYQSKRTLKEREQLKGHFYLSEKIENKDIIIIDDVTSTGTTINKVGDIFGNNNAMVVCLFRGRPYYQ